MARTSQIRKNNRSVVDKPSELPAPKKPILKDYPGLGLPLRYNKQDDYGFYPIGAHGSCYGSDSDLLPVRELAMMNIMDRLTDKPDWEKKVFDEEIVAKWRKEAMEVDDEAWEHLAKSDKTQSSDNVGMLFLPNDPGAQGEVLLKGVMDKNTFDCIVKELRSKAKYYEQSGIIPTLDACASVAKSDKLVSVDLHELLRSAFDKLKADQSESPDWHPSSSDMVQDLVHPSMYPLVYGRSNVIKEEVVGVEDAVEKWAGKGETIEKDCTPPENQYAYGVGSGTVLPEYWSDTYQWLPANVAFKEGGGVEFTSYINNLHPTKYPDVYRTIEKLIEASLPAWDQCLALASGYHSKEGAGRTESRFPMPDDPDDSNGDNWDPSGPSALADVEVNWKEVADKHSFNPEYDDESEEKWKLLRKPVIPDASFKEIKYAPKVGFRLFDRFAESGLQVIVKMASIELTPEKPDFPVGGWHIEGQMNEHIAATALYYLDSENITDTNLSFRMQTSAYMEDNYEVGQDAYHWMEQIYGTGLGCGNSPCLQNYGSVETVQGRLLAFPNVFQHKVSSFKLVDPTKPGHRRFIALWLVDPTQRIISTANVPPQQQHWWLDAIFGDTPESRNAVMEKLPAEVASLLKVSWLNPAQPGAVAGTLPPELMEMVRENFDADNDTLPMGLEEAKEHREKLMKARGAFVKTSEQWWQKHTYSFCEH